MKRLFCVLFTFLLIMQLSGTAVIAETASSEVVFTIGTVTGAPGETVSVELTVESSVKWNSIALSAFEYDTDVLTFVGFENYEEMAEQAFLSSFDNEKGAITVALNPAQVYSGKLCDLVFTINENAANGATSAVRASTIAKLNSTGLSSAIVSGSVSVACAHKNTTNVPETPADCDESGFTAGVWCNDCETYISGHEVIPATGAHADADGKWESNADNHFHTCACGAKFDTAKHNGGNANCTTKAVCEVCGTAYGAVDSTKHGETEVRDAIEATCSKDGYTGDTYCKDCGEKIATGSVIPTTGAHVDADGKWESDADNHFHTCGCGAKFDSAAHSGGTAACTEKAACSICGAEYGTVDSTKHGETEVRGAIEATCAKDGYTGDTYCKDCGEKIATGSVIPATGHSLGDWYVTLAPTCLVKGEEQRDCEKCDYYETNAIEPTGEHVDADGKWESDADNHFHTCGCGTEFNSAAHSGGTANCVNKAECAVCGAEYGEVDADNHNEEFRGAVAATEESEGYTGDTYCKDCGEKLADGEVIAKLDHTHAMEKTDKTDATHEADGNIEYYTCSKCGKLYQDEAGTQEITIEETVIAKGEHTYEIANDGDQHWEECACGSVINEAAHTYGDWTETKAPSATETGSKERVCSVCGHKQAEELPKVEEALPPQTGDVMAVVAGLSAVAVIAAGVFVFKKKRICD